MTDSYPEYLNPFAEDAKPKSKLRISNSFREFKRSLRKSFRIKKKEDEDVTIRQKTSTPRRVPVSYPSNQQIAWPRSRFQERLTKCEPSTSTPGPNPFDEVENREAKTVTIRRKGKKRAPLPPKSLSSQDVNDDDSLEVPNRGSRWSLTSADTDYSCSTDNVSYGVETEVDKGSLVEKFVDFNKEMEKLTDDSNNNIITKEDIRKETESNNNIPDLVISCPSDTESAKLTINDDKDDTDSEENHSENNIIEEKKSEENTSDTESELGDNKEIIVTDITNNMITDESNKINTITEEKGDKKYEEDPYLYHEKKSLYIAGSRDELNESNTYTGRVSLYITGSSDDLDACNNNEVCDKNGTDENSNDDAVPIPKQRKNKLTKNVLLGM